FLCFFFQAEDGIRDFHVTGVQTCALPISVASRAVVSYTTVSPLPVVLAHPSAVCSLLHCPSSCDARLLAGTLPCELGLSSTGAKPAAIRTRFPSVKQHCQCARQDSNLKPPDP